MGQLDIPQVVDRLDIVGDVKKDKNKVFKAIMTGNESSLKYSAINDGKDHSKDSYFDKVVDGANIRFNAMLDDPAGTAKDAALGIVNSFPDLVSTVGDFLDVETPASDSVTKYLKSQLSDKDSLGFDMTTITGAGGLAAKPLKKMYNVIDDTAQTLADATHIKQSIGSDISFIDALKDAGKGTVSRLASKVLETEQKATKPSIRIIDGKIDGAYGKHLGTSTLDRDSKIYVATKGPNGPRTKDEIKSTLWHEIDHRDWVKKHGSMSGEPIKMSRGTTDDLVKDADWSAKPWEINAQAKQIQKELRILKRNPNDTEATMRLIMLVENTKPFVDNFIKKYPGEKGDYILKGMDWLENTRLHNPRPRGGYASELYNN